MFVPEHPDGLFEDSIWSAQLDAALARLSRSSRVYSFLTEGTSGTHGFSWYVGGARRRLWLWQAGSLVMEMGAPLQEEDDAAAEDPDGEQMLFALMEKLTGVFLDDVLAQRFSVFA